MFANWLWVNAMRLPCTPFADWVVPPPSPAGPFIRRREYISSAPCGALSFLSRFFQVAVLFVLANADAVVKDSRQLLVALTDGFQESKKMSSEL